MSTPALGPARDGATLTLTKAQTELLEASLRDLGGESDVFVARFYEHLFALRPELSELFQGADRAGMRAKLFSTLALFVDNLEEPDRVEPVLRALASRHVGYGVEPEHLPLFRTAILRTLDETYGETMTPQLRAAWEVTLSRLVQIIQPELAAA